MERSRKKSCTVFGRKISDQNFYFKQGGLGGQGPPSLTWGGLGGLCPPSLTWGGLGGPLPPQLDLSPFFFSKIAVGRGTEQKKVLHRTSRVHLILTQDNIMKDEPFETRLLKLCEKCPEELPNLFRKELHKKEIFDLLCSPRLLKVVRKILSVADDIRIFPN